MKKISIAVCVCAVLFSFSNYGECVREVSAQTFEAEENLAILQDIIRENECQAGMKSMLLFQDLIVRSVFIRLRLRKKGNIWKI